MQLESTTIHRFRGDTNSIPFDVLEQCSELGVPITGATFRLTVHSIENPPDDATKLFQLTAHITDDAAGEIEFPVDEDAAEFVGTLFFDLEMRDAGEMVFQLFPEKAPITVGNFLSLINKLPFLYN